MSDVNWQTMDTAAKDGSQMQMYCPGVSAPTNGVLIGGWSVRLAIWQLYPYGTTQPVALAPSMWAPLTAPPVSPPAG